MNQELNRQVLTEAWAEMQKRSAFEQAKSIMPTLKEKFDREMLIDCMVELANKYAFRFPEATNKLFALAIELKNPLPPVR